MKLTNKQLRKIISETVKTRSSSKNKSLAEAGDQSLAHDGDDVADFVTEALYRWIEEDGGADIIGSNAFEMMAGTAVNDSSYTGVEHSLPRDVDKLARVSAERVLSAPEIVQAITEICKNIHESAENI